MENFSAKLQLATPTLKLCAFKLRTFTFFPLCKIVWRYDGKKDIYVYVPNYKGAKFDQLHKMSFCCFAPKKWTKEFVFLSWKVATYQVCKTYSAEWSSNSNLSKHKHTLLCFYRHFPVKFMGKNNVISVNRICLWNIKKWPINRYCL